MKTSAAILLMSFAGLALVLFPALPVDQAWQYIGITAAIAAGVGILTGILWCWQGRANQPARGMVWVELIEE